MSIKQGYKQTDIGIIPQEWEVKSYDEVFHFLKTATYSRAELSDNESIQYVHYGDIHTQWSHFVDFKKTDLPSISNEKRGSYTLLKEGDIIMADASEDYSGIGKSVEVKNIGDIQAISGLHTFLLRDKDNHLADGFKGYLHSNKVVKNQFDRLATGLKVYGVSKNNLKIVQIPTPPLPEQKAIAQALSDTDALITALDALIAKKRLIKQGTMQQLLTGKRRLEGFTEGWKFDKIKNQSSITTGSKNTQDRIEDGDFPFFVRSQTVETINSYSFDGEAVLTAGDGVGTGKVIHYINGKFDCHQRVYKISNFSKDLDGYFFYIYFKNNFLDRVMSMTAKSSVDSVRMEMIADMEIPIPPVIEQKAIAKILSDMDTEIASLEAKHDKYKQVKQGMMQELLTGKIRLI